MEKKKIEWKMKINGVEFKIDVKDGVNLETTAGSFGMGLTQDFGKFESVFLAIKKLQELRKVDGYWHKKATITGKNGCLSLPMPSLTYIIEDNKIFDDEGNLQEVDALTGDYFLYFVKEV